jgi:hypothetical protein
MKIKSSKESIGHPCRVAYGGTYQPFYTFADVEFPNDGMHGPDCAIQVAIPQEMSTDQAIFCMQSLLGRLRRDIEAARNLPIGELDLESARRQTESSEEVPF